MNNLYMTLLKMLVQELVKEAIDALTTFFRQLLRIIFCGENPFQQHGDEFYTEPTA
jgi:hypothetical protein